MVLPAPLPYIVGLWSIPTEHRQSVQFWPRIGQNPAEHQPERAPTDHTLPYTTDSCPSVHPAVHLLYTVELRPVVHRLAWLLFDSFGDCRLVSGW